jgi:hypothetical protein
MIDFVFFRYYKGHADHYHMMPKNTLNCIQKFFDQIQSRGAYDLAWLATIDPLHFTMHPDNLTYNCFKFVFASTSPTLRDMLDDYIVKMLTITSKMNMGVKDCKNIQKVMRKILHAPSAHTDMEHLLRVIEVYAFLTFQAGTTLGMGIHYRKSTAILGLQPIYFIYVGSEDSPSPMILDRFLQKMSEGNLPTARQSLITLLWQDKPPN